MSIYSHFYSLESTTSILLSVLKMIANILTEDSRHIVGGSVQVNGVDSKDNDIVWSVCAQSSQHTFLVILSNDK